MEKGPGEDQAAMHISECEITNMLIEHCDLLYRDSARCFKTGHVARCLHSWHQLVLQGNNGFRMV